ncbi:MAG: hypothetical protein ACXW3C_08440 [Pyrinomonadaceae bacterium]
MKHAHKPCTPDIELDGFDGNELSAQMYSMVQSFVFALVKQARKQGTVEFTELPQALIRVFLTTHQSMLLLVDTRFSHPLMAADGISLVREQVEKVYLLALVVDDPKKWTTQYHRANWKFKYERFLRTERDQRSNPRFQEYFKTYGQLLDQGRFIVGKPRSRHTAFISKRMARSVRYRFENPDAKKDQFPPWFDQNKFDNYFRFPTPGKAIKQVRDEPTREFLRQWYKEYKWLCQYSHISVDKVFLNAISQSKSQAANKKFEDERTRRVEDAVMVSFLATGSACAILLKTLDDDYGAKAELARFWDVLRRHSLDGYALWKMYVASLIPE